MDTLILLEIAHRHFQDTLDTANLDRMTAHRDAEKRCHRLLRLSWKRSTVRVRRFWLLRLLALGFLGLRPFLCIRLGRRLGLREARGTVPLALERWYDFHSLGSHLGNVGLTGSDQQSSTFKASLPLLNVRFTPDFVAKRLLD